MIFTIPIFFILGIICLILTITLPFFFLWLGYKFNIIEKASWAIFILILFYTIGTAALILIVKISANDYNELNPVLSDKYKITFTQKPVVIVNKELLEYGD